MSRKREEEDEEKEAADGSTQPKTSTPHKDVGTLNLKAITRPNQSSALRSIS